MAAKQLMLPANRAFNSNGLAISGAQAKLFASGTSTPANFYADSGLVTSLGSTLTANGAGRFSAAYGDSTIPYRLKVVDSDGAVLDDIDPYYFGLTTGVDGTSASVQVHSTATGLAGSSAAVANSGTAQNVLLDFTIPTGAQGPAGDVAAAASRTALAAIVGPTAGTTRYLRESGREGTFVWSSANNSANVTADPQQGLYVAPASDTSGASGAWVRKFNGRANPQWWGGTWDGIVDDSAAVNAAVATALALAGSNITGYGTAAFSLRFPFLTNGVFMGTTPMATLTKAIALYGESGGHFGGEGTVFKWAVGMTGSAIKITAPNCWFDGIALEGPYVSGTSLEAEIHGIEATAYFGYGRLWVRGFQGDGVNINAVDINGTNANGTRGFSLHVSNNRNGLATSGNNANACHFAFIDANYNRVAGVNEGSGLGNNYGCIQTSGNGVTSIAGIPTTCCYNNGFMFAVVSGQETAAQTNSPPSTAVNNTWWNYVRTLVAATTYAPQWVSGTQTFRAGGGFYVPFAVASNASTVSHLYTESDQAPTQAAQGVMIYGGLNPPGFGPTTRHMAAGNNGVTLTSAYLTRKMSFIPDAGNQFIIDGTVSNTSPVIDLKDGAAGGGQFIQLHDSSNVLKGSIRAGSGLGLIFNHVAGLLLQFNATTVASINSTGLNIASAMNLQFNGTPVFSTSGVLLAAGFPVLTGDVTTAGGSLATTIAANAVTYAKFQQVAASSLIGNATGSLANATGITLAGGLAFSGTAITLSGAITAASSIAIAGAITSSSATAGIGYATGAGGAVTQLTSRTTGVTLNKVCGAITLFSAAGSATWATFTVTNSAVAATDVIDIVQKSGANLYSAIVTAVAAGSFNVSISAVSGTATEAPVFNFAVNKAVAA